MHALANSYQKLRRGEHLDAADCDFARGPDPRPFQLSSLAVQLLLAPARTADEDAVLRHLTASHPAIAGLLAGAFPEQPFVKAHLAGVTPDDRAALLRGTARDRRIGEPALQALVDDLVAERIDLTFLAGWLMTVCVRGMSPADTDALTAVMLRSGSVTDYRNLPELGRVPVIRRYPTGGLSEKTALILPSLLASVRDRYPLVTAFVVARSLSFTGGTWDKLRSIPGFTFPEPGDGCIAAMRACSVAMTVTQGDVNPADRKLYQFRSLTGTVENHELIASSVASKQLAMPADLLLMDVRHGPGAFLPTRADGERMGHDLVRMIESGGVPCCFHLTGTDEPNGTAVGNALEVLEAIALMRGDNDPRWDPRALSEQLELVLTFFALLMERTFPGQTRAHWLALGREEFASGRVFESFLAVLATHRVEAATLAAIRTRPETVIGPQFPGRPVQSPRAGVVRGLDQKRLGGLVNFGLGGGGNDFGGTFDPTPGVVIHKRLGDAVQAGEPLCSLFAPTPGDALCAELGACFVVD